MANEDYSIHPCPNMSVQDLVDFCTNHDISLNTKICVAKEYLEIMIPFAVDEIALIDNEIVLFNYA